MGKRYVPAVDDSSTFKQFSLHDELCIKETVEFYIQKSKQLNEYNYSCSDGALIQSSIKINTVYSLAFCFICGCVNKDTFGKDKRIFMRINLMYI